MSANKDLQIAIEYKNFESAKAALEAGADPNINALYATHPLIIDAINRGRNNIAKLLIQYDVNLDVTDYDGNTPLHLAAQQDNSYGMDCDKELIKNILDKDVDLNALNSRRLPPLAYTLKEKHLDIVKLLVTYGADLKALTGSKEDILYFAAESHSKPLIQYLLDQGMDANATFKFGNPMLRHITFRKDADLDFLSFLIDSGADPNAVGDYKNTILREAVKQNKLMLVKFLIAKGCSVKEINKDGYSLLHESIKHTKDTTLTKLFINEGLDVNAKNNDGDTPLSLLDSDKYQTNMMNVLLKNKANPNIPDKNGDTVLHKFARNGKLYPVKMLLKYGADPTLKNNKGETPLEAANSRKYEKDEDMIAELTETAKKFKSKAKLFEANVQTAEKDITTLDKDSEEPTPIIPEWLNEEL